MLKIKEINYTLYQALIITLYGVLLGAIIGTLIAYTHIYIDL